MPISLKVAQSTSEKDEIFRLRHTVFVEEEERFQTTNPRVADHFDSFDETVNIIAYDDKQAIGTIRVNLTNPIGFPAQEHYDFDPFLEKHQHNTACIGWLCTLKKYRKHPGLIMGLFKMAVREMKKNNHRYIIATIHPPLMNLLEKGFGAQKFSDIFTSRELGVEMLPIHIDVDNFPPGSKEPFQDPPHLLLDESPERRIYKKNEMIYQEDTKGEEAFLILRGAVRTLPPSSSISENITWKTLSGPVNKHDTLLTKGNLFGFLPLLDGGTHYSTALPYSKEVDLMVWPRKAFINQLQEDPRKSLNITQIMGSRLRREIFNNEFVPSASDVGRVLFDASREGEDPVSKEWLGRQCGTWPQQLEEILEKWCSNQWISIQDNTKIFVDDPDLFYDGLKP